MTWYDDGAVSGCAWQFRQVVLGSAFIKRKLPPAGALCMEWQPPHSAALPEWKAYAILLNPMVSRAAAMITRLNLTTFISLLLIF